MYKFINGYTKAKFMKRLRKYNNGTRAVQPMFSETDASFSVSQCMYLTSDGNSCAVGCFIPRNKPYSARAFANKGTVPSLLANVPELHGYMPLTDRALYELQSIHDSPSTIDVYKAVECWLNKNVKGCGES